MERFPRATQLAHELVAKRIGDGSRAVDATVGNGHDTRFLAKQVGVSGSVTGFDVQKAAVSAAKERTQDLPQVSIHLAGHEEMERFVKTPVKAVMFNLGYLPSSDKTVITVPETTIPALESATRLLAPGGILTIVAYPGHEGGDEEASSVDAWSRRLSSEIFSVIRYEFLNRETSPPFLIGIEKVL